MKLTLVQREVLLALVDLYQRSRGEAVKGEGIAELINRNPGTVRNLMQSLRSLGLVDGVPGPKGGYRPTTEAYKALNFEDVKDAVTVLFYDKSGIIEGVTITGIDLISISDPIKCRAAIHAIGNLKNLNIGDEVQIGPTPINKLMIKGRILGRDDMENVILLEILEMMSIPKDLVKNIASLHVKTLSADTTVREAAEIIHREEIRGGPVIKNGKPVGILSTVDITKAIAMHQEDHPVEEFMSHKVVTINEDAMIADAIDLMQSSNISRLIVVNNTGKTKGIVTRTDILCRIASICRPGI